MAATLLAIFKRPAGGDDELATFLAALPRRTLAADRAGARPPLDRSRTSHPELRRRRHRGRDAHDVRRPGRARCRRWPATRCALPARVLREIAPGLADAVGHRRRVERRGSVTVHYEVEGRVATVRIDRPDVLNALDRPTLEAIRDSFRKASADHRSRRGRAHRNGRPRLLDRRRPGRAGSVPRPAQRLLGLDGPLHRGHRGDQGLRQARRRAAQRHGRRRRQRAEHRVRPGGCRGRRRLPPRRAVARLAARRWRDAVDAAVGRGSPGARSLLLNRPFTAEQALEWGWINRVVPRCRSWTRPWPTTAQELLAKMPEIVRATRFQLNFWKDLSWAMTVRHGARVADDPRRFGRGRRGARRASDRSDRVDYERLRADIENAGGPARGGRDQTRTDRGGCR